MPTYKTPEELRAWSRSFKRSKSSIIKRCEYKYTDPNEKEKTEDNNNEENDKNTDSGDTKSSVLAEDILKNISSAKVDSLKNLFDLDKSTIDELNKQYPSIEEQFKFLEKNSNNKHN